MGNHKARLFPGRLIDINNFDWVNSFMEMYCFIPDVPWGARAEPSAWGEDLR
jgi:hypothetical protein